MMLCCFLFVSQPRCFLLGLFPYTALRIFIDCAVLCVEELYRFIHVFMLFLPDPRRHPAIKRGRGGGRCLYHTHPQTSKKNVCIRFFPNSVPCGTQPVSQSSLLRLEKVREVEEFLYACVWNNEASVGRIGRSVGWSGGKETFIARTPACDSRVARVEGRKISSFWHPPDPKV